MACSQYDYLGNDQEIAACLIDCWIDHNLRLAGGMSETESCRTYEHCVQGCLQ